MSAEDFENLSGKSHRGAGCHRHVQSPCLKEAAIQVGRVRGEAGASSKGDLRFQVASPETVGRTPGSWIKQC